MPQRKNLQRANRTAFFIIGVLESAWAPLVPFVKEAFSLDEGEAGMLMLCSGLGALIALLLAGKLCMRFGAKRTVYIAAVIMVLCLLFISLMIDVRATAALLLLFGGCIVIIDVAANVNGISLERKTGRRLMSGFHGGYSLGTLIGAAAMSVLLSVGLLPPWAVGICAAMTIALMAWRCSALLSRDELRIGVQAEREERNGRFHIPPMVIAVGALCFIIYAAEGAVLGWSAIFVNQERGVDIQHAGFFFTVFAIAMTGMRLCGDRIVDRLGRHHVVVTGALLIAAGFLLVILIPSVIAAALGFALTGLGAANIVPQLISFASGIKGMAVQDINSLINAFGFSGLLVGPVVIGFVAKNYGLHTSFALIAVLSLAVAAAVHRMLKVSPTDKQSPVLSEP